jgi:hypothetical protein
MRPLQRPLAGQMPPQNAHPMTLALNPKFLGNLSWCRTKDKHDLKAPYFMTKETLD